MKSRLCIVGLAFLLTAVLFLATRPSAVSRDQGQRPAETLSAPEPPVTPYSESPAPIVTPLVAAAPQETPAEEVANAPIPSIAVVPAWPESADESSNSPPSTVDALDLSGFKHECERVQTYLDAHKAQPRDVVLTACANSALSSAQFSDAAAACAMFLREFGTEHAYSPQMAVWLGDGLAPLDLDNTELAYTDDGPRYNPTWKAGQTADEHRLRQAVAAYELAARIATEEYNLERSLLVLGWLHRALGEWEASTEAFDRSHAAIPDYPLAREAAGLAVENLALTGYPKQAADRLRAIAARTTDFQIAQSFLARADELDAEAARSLASFADPVPALIAEIARRAGSREPQQVYRGFADWLLRAGQKQALAVVHRWACEQADWPALARVEACLNVSDALRSESSDSDRADAIAALQTAIELAPSTDFAAPAAIRCSRLLRDMSQYDLSEQTLADVQERAGDAPAWLAEILCERVRLRLAQGDRKGARTIYEDLATAFPHSEFTDRFAGEFPVPVKETSK
ncbi:MAG TPA: hypothetical protein VGM03_00025 [Phycisphaerae bacterium]|jgi:tetratricopeptide (TPR) repeat protein